MELNKIGEVWTSANRLVSDFIGLLSSKNFATMATWRKDFSCPFKIVHSPLSAEIHFKQSLKKFVRE